MGGAGAVNVRRVAALLRELADELEKEAPANDEAPAPRVRRKLQKSTPLGVERAERALRRAGVYPPGEWQK